MTSTNTGRLVFSTDDSTRLDASEKRFQLTKEIDYTDEKFGFFRFKDGKQRLGWLINMHTTEILDENKRLTAAVDYLFVQQNCERFKVSVCFKPYLYVLPAPHTHQEVIMFLTKKYLGLLHSVELVDKEDLSLPNHLIGLKRKYLRLSFFSVTDLLSVRKDLLTAVRHNSGNSQFKAEYIKYLHSHLAYSESEETTISSRDQLSNIVDVREHDVPYHVRVGIDTQVFVANWYSVTCLVDTPTILPPTSSSPSTDAADSRCLIEWPEAIVLAYDIETTKSPLKFPDAKNDQIMMLSYMVDGRGFLITNREIISQNIEDFEYTPRPEYEGLFTVFNEPSERALIERFFSHVIQIKPHVIVTYNGDNFDFPFLETRAAHYEIDMFQEIGFSKSTDGAYLSHTCVHIDCLCWVRRDSYLPVGSQGLKAVTKAKLHYDPVELDPELMCSMACEQPQVLSNYSVSDAVATYYLYMKYIHPFIFALCTILPMTPDEVLRKGSGTLCEALLMVQAYKANVIFPNKQLSSINRVTDDGHVLDSETYVGGHVEAIESGVFRADIPCRFRVDTTECQNLIDRVESTVRFALEVEEKVCLDDVENFRAVVNDIVAKLTDLRDSPNRLENPAIYHMDVGAMYPNIILTNRLQPSAIVDETVCAACDFNRPSARCQRDLSWVWRAELMPAKRNELQHIRQQLETEKFPTTLPNGSTKEKPFHELTRDEQTSIEKKRLSDYCRKAYKKLHITRTEERTTTVCQRENSFYVDTVRSFRDRRYEYKALNKDAKKRLAAAQTASDTSEIRMWNGRVILYDSLQLAHKCILNSFYGYVMRRGARWHSMEMAGIVCHTGASLITKAREIIEKVGRPLELDTDGIWCMLPASFPDSYEITTRIPGPRAKLTISYPNAVLNQMVKENFTNNQYHDCVDSATLKFNVRSENSIFFEVDGPYLAMVLPASKDEGKKLKKRYAVFNFDGSLAELKGFEMKRRGELKIIKLFQSSVFNSFLRGSTLCEVYEEAASIADYWLDVLYSKGQNVVDSELFELISENRSMSKRLSEYGDRKSTSTATARRLAEFLGDQVVKDAGLSCQYIISKLPEGASVTERAIPLAIFHAEPSIMKYYLRRWIKDASIVDFDIREILDWEYYIERLNGCIQKIITIPAALQGVANPVPRVRHPDWLHKRILDRADTHKQRKLSDMFAVAPSTSSTGRSSNTSSAANVKELRDIEDIGVSHAQTSNVPVVTTLKSSSKILSTDSKQTEEDDCLAKSWLEVLGATPSIGSDRESLKTWVEFQKRKWHYQHKQRLARNRRIMLAERGVHTTFARATNTTAPPGVGLSSNSSITAFIKRTRKQLLNSCWQIIQIVETSQPGLFRMWCLVDDSLHSIKLVVPRVFYVNQRCDTQRLDIDGNCYSVKCVKLLPRSHHVYNLFKYSMPEQVFQQHKRYILANLSSSDIEGIYELQIPLLFRIVSELGCVTQIDPRCHRELMLKSTGDNFDSVSIDQLIFCPLTRCRYLHPADYKTITLHVHTTTSGVHPTTSTSTARISIYALFLPSLTPRAVFVIACGRDPVNQMPNLRSLYNSLWTSRLNEGTPESSLPPSEFTFSVSFETTDSLALRAINRQLQLYKDEKRGSTIVAIHSVIASSVLCTQIPALNSFPVVSLQASSADSNSFFQSLDWQKSAAKIILANFLDSPNNLTVLIEQCRYLHCPVGNLATDVAIFGLDLFFSRQLRKHNYVLWATPNDKSDLGGKELEDYRMMLDNEIMTGTELNSAGAYQFVSTELEVEGLATMAIMHSTRINESEGVSSYTSFDTAPQISLEEMLSGDPNQLKSYDESVLSYSAFKVLRTMVNCFLIDVIDSRNIYADHMLIHLYRWLRNPASLLFDPALKKILHILMKKLFIQLISDLRELNAIIVYATFNRLIVCTKKRALCDAKSYIEYILATLKSRELFHALEITVCSHWSYLLWCDASNYGGVKAPTTSSSPHNELVQTDLHNEGGEESRTDNGETTVSVDMFWNMCSFLPEVGGCQASFNTIIAGYVSAMFQRITHENNILSSSCLRNNEIHKQRHSLCEDNMDLVESTDTLAEYSVSLVTGDLAQKLFLITERIHKKFGSLYEEDANKVFPQRPGSHFSLSNPALEFVKTICKVLSLDSNLTCCVLKLRRDMLRLIDVPEFSPQAEWNDPCLSFVLPEIICQHCNHCRDLDLCRHCTQDTDGWHWYCPVCQSSHDTDEIQHALIQELQKNVVSYLLQDYQCTKCKQVKQLNLSLRCECAGDFKCMFTLDELNRKLLHVFVSIADAFHLPLLRDYVDQILLYIS